MRRLFNNKNATKKNPSTSNKPLVQTMNYTAKNTKRKAQSTEIGTGKSFSNHIKQPINGPTKQEEKNATNALLFG